MRVPDTAASPAAKRALQALVDHVTRHDADSVGDVILYGSQVRGDAGTDSDVDVLITWNGDRVAGEDHAAQITADLFLATGVLIEAHVMTTQHWQHLREVGTLFAKNVETEGVLLAA